MWEYQGKKFEDPKDYFGFIYIIENLTTGRIYVGQKYFYHTIKKKFGKKRIAQMKDKRAKKWEYVKKDSGWRDYWGSVKGTPNIKDDKKKGHKFKRTILKLVSEKRHMLYYETYYQFLYKVLELKSYNGNINGKFYKTLFED